MNGWCLRARAYKLPIIFYMSSSSNLLNIRIDAQTFLIWLSFRQIFFLSIVLRGMDLLLVCTWLLLLRCLSDCGIKWHNLCFIDKIEWWWDICLLILFAVACWWYDASQLISNIWLATIGWTAAWWIAIAVMLFMPEARCDGEWLSSCLFCFTQPQFAWFFLLLFILFV